MTIGMLNFSDSGWREIKVQWQPPAKDWVKCNVNGANKEDGSVSGCGGLVRDSSGRWRSGFLKRLGAMDSLSSEAWSILTGLRFARQEGFRQVLLENDSVNAIDFINKGFTPDHPL